MPIPGISIGIGIGPVLDKVSVSESGPKILVSPTPGTDGSLQSDGQAAAGVYICGGLETHGYRLGEGVDICQAEVYAILKAAQWVLNNPEEVQGEVVVINVDSQGALAQLQQVNVYSNSLAAAIETLNEAASHCESLKLRWVKSHQDNNPLYIGNCNADAVAVAAAKNLHQTVESDAPKPTKTTWKKDLSYRVDLLWEHMVSLLSEPNRIRQTRDWISKPA